MGDPKAGIDKIRKLQLGMMEFTGPNRRGQHQKAHGLVTATFEVLADIPDQYKVGLFAKPANYKAYIRYSNGKELEDTKADVHGMAIKLTGVPGQKVLEAEASATSHDFILADNPVFFIRDVDEYVRFTEDFAHALPEGKEPLSFLAWLTLHHPQDLPLFVKLKHHRDSPLATRYWSQVPYAFGTGASTICRYGVVPDAGNMVAAIPQADRDADYLRRAMRDHLTSSRQSAKFEFTVQLHSNATAAVIDTPTIAWDTPEQRVGIITIPPQEFDSDKQMFFCESLSYTPWHALPEHRPIGQINEIRKAVYEASSSKRHGTVPRSEPTGNEF